MSPGGIRIESWERDQIENVARGHRLVFSTIVVEIGRRRSNIVPSQRHCYNYIIESQINGGSVPTLIQLVNLHQRRLSDQ